MLTQIKKKGKAVVEGRGFLILVIILVAVIAFGLGRLSKIEEARVPVRIETAEFGKVSGSSVSINAAAVFVASRQGSKYHFPWCSGAQRIKESNKISFNSREDAERAGYTPAANCKGL